MIGLGSDKNLQHNYSKMREGVKGHLEFFQKFIRFGSGILPFARNVVEVWAAMTSASSSERGFVIEAHFIVNLRQGV